MDDEAQIQNLTRAQSRRWCGTLNNYREDHKEPPQWVLDVCDGGVWAREKGEQGTPHIQAFLFFKKRMTLGGIRRLFPDGINMHLEICKGNSYQNFQYCTKGGDFTQFGEIPTDGFPKRNKRDADEEWKRTWDLAVSGEHNAITPEKRIKYYATIKQIGADYAKPPERLSVQPGVWIHGPAGYGKSWMARGDFGGPVYTKDFTKWWPRYCGEPVVVLDDIAPDHGRVLGDYLKIWGDIYPFNGETKGGVHRTDPSINLHRYFTVCDP